MSYTVDVFPTQNLVSKITIIRVKKGCLKNLDNLSSTGMDNVL